MIKHFYLTHRWEPNEYYYSGSSETRINANEGVGYIRQTHYQRQGNVIPKT